MLLGNRLMQVLYKCCMVV